MAYKNPDQERADEFVRKLAKGPGSSSDVVLDVLTGKSPKREDAQAQGGDSLASHLGKKPGPQRGSKV
jgi:hypothetical protein